MPPSRAPDISSTAGNTNRASDPTYDDGGTFLDDVGASGNPDHAENPGYYSTCRPHYAAATADEADADTGT